MPPLHLLPTSFGTTVDSLRATFSARLTSTWNTTPNPAPPPRSADLFMILFVSVFLFITAALLRLVPWVSPIRPHPRWHEPPLHSDEADALRGFRAFSPYGALDPYPHPLQRSASSQAPTYETLLEIGDRIGTAKHGLRDDQIDILPTYRCTDSRDDPDDARRGLKCAICRDKYCNAEQICILPCGDEYHAECIAPWLRQQATCPLCRCRFA